MITKRWFYGFVDGKESTDFDVIMLMSSLYCDLQFPVTIKEKYKNYRVICIGNFLKKMIMNICMTMINMRQQK